jgi:hypothetical protein
MRRIHIPALLLFLAASPALPAGHGAAQQIDSLALRAHTRFLADDLLLGRGTGTQGEKIAAQYIISQAIRLGLSPVPGSNRFEHPVPLRVAEIEAASHVVLQTGADSAAFRHGDDFVVNTGGPGALRDFRGRALFFGQPAHATELIRRERSMVGRVAVFLGPLGADALDIIPTLSHAGAAGIVLLVPDPVQFDLYVRSRGSERFFIDAAVDDPVWQPNLPVLIAGPALSQALLAGREVPDALIEGTGAIAFDLGRSIIARIRARLRAVDAANVAAVLPGSDASRRHEFIAFSAHFDHLGVSVPDARGDSIYNGFSDNAAGVAMLLAIAEALRDAPPARSLLFLFFTGEERGLLGSSFMATQPPVPLDRITALINLDAGAPPAPPTSWRIAGGESPLAQTAVRVAENAGWTATTSPAAPNSDYWPFLRRGVPSIFIIPGDQWENTTTAQRAALRQRWDRYHQAGDHWHADFPFAGLTRYADFAMRVALEMARQH